MRTWRVGDIANWLDITTNGVYYLEKHGAVSPVHDEENGYRTFTNDDFATLSFVRHYQALGFTLDESLRLLDGSPSELANAVADALEQENIRHEETVRRLNELAHVTSAIPSKTVIELAARPALLALPVPDELEGETPQEKAERGLQDQLDYAWHHVDGASFGFILEQSAKHPAGFAYRRCTVAPAQKIRDADLADRDATVDFPADPWCAHVTVPLETNVDDASFVGPVLDELASHGLRCKGPVVERIAHLRRVPHGLEVSREFWIPVSGSAASPRG